jgi:hydroxymethylglutaryl-CoA lyase
MMISPGNVKEQPTGYPVSKVKLIECPRDAMQGWKKIIPTEKKVEYINALLSVGFDTIDFGSFVSAKTIPQMADTKEVVRRLNPGRTKLLAIVANYRGAEEACRFENIHYIGFPFSVSETFQLRNTNSSIAGSFDRVRAIHELCMKTGKKLVIYISMGFGNPYGDAFSKEIVFEWVNKLVSEGVEIVSLADTVGLADSKQVAEMTAYLVKTLPQTEIGVHLHSTTANWRDKLEAAYLAGCRRFDGALKGIGGCPMANDELVGNMDTERMIQYFRQQQINLSLNEEALALSLRLAGEIFV